MRRVLANAVVTAGLLVPLCLYAQPRGAPHSFAGARGFYSKLSCCRAQNSLTPSAAQIRDPQFQRPLRPDYVSTCDGHVPDQSQRVIMSPEPFLCRFVLLPAILFWNSRFGL